MSEGHGLTALEAQLAVNTTTEPDQTAEPVSPTSSQGSWVFNPEDGGWDGLGQSPLLSPRHQASQPHVHQRSLTASTCPLGSWAGMPSSSVAVEYPPSPPGSPGSVKSEGLADLARDEVVVAMDGLAAALAMVSTAGVRGCGRDKRADEHLAETTSSRPQLQQQEDEQGEDKADDGVNIATNAIGVSRPDGAVAAEGVVCAAEAIREAKSPEAVGAVAGPAAPPSKPASVSASQQSSLAAASGISSSTATAVGVDVKRTGSATSEAIRAPVPRPATPPSIRRSGGAVPVARFHPAGTSYPRAATPPITASPRRGCSTSPSSSNAGGPQVVRRLESSQSSSRLPGGNPLGLEEDYDGKNAERLWKWTGLITAAKMGVLPIMLCAALAALSSQTGGGDDRGGRDGGGGRGGGGPTRCSSRRRPRGGGGGNGCFPSMRADRYGCMPMPYCVAPSIFVAA